MNKNVMISMKKNLSEYKAVLFDVDGTLYFQPKLRLFMARDLALYFLRHPLHIRELLILKKYRTVRENWESISSASNITCGIIDDISGGNAVDIAATMQDAQYQYTASQMHISPAQVEETVTYWLHRHPLKSLIKCRDHKLAGIIASLQNRSVITAAYSDYPAAEKLYALSVSADFIFSSSDKEINCMKPNRKAMQFILKTLDCSPDEVLMIGDRYSKDGLAAKNAGMDFCILPKSIPARNKLYYTLNRYSTPHP